MDCPKGEILLVEKSHRGRWFFIYLIVCRVIYMRLADFDTQDHNVFRALHVRADLVAITQLNILSIRTHWPSLYIDFVRAVDIHLAIAYCQLLSFLFHYKT